MSEWAEIFTRLCKHVFSCTDLPNWKIHTLELKLYKGHTLLHCLSAICTGSSKKGDQLFQVNEHTEIERFCDSSFQSRISGEVVMPHTKACSLTKFYSACSQPDCLFLSLCLLTRTWKFGALQMSKIYGKELWSLSEHRLDRVCWQLILLQRNWN